MATTFIEGIAVRPGRTPLVTARDSIEYITNPIKTDGGRLVTAFLCSPKSAYLEIMMQQHEYEQHTGRKVIQDYGGKKQSYMLMTMRQSFAPGEVTPEQAHEIGCELAKRFLGDKYQYVVATHIDKHCVHNHITFSIIGSDMKKFRQTKYTHKRLAEISDKLCEERHLIVVVPSPEWQNRKYTNDRVTPYRTILKSDIDRAIESAKSFEEFLMAMEQSYRVVNEGKYLKFRHRTNGQQRYVRSYTLGAAYTEQNIRDRIAGLYLIPEEKKASQKKAVREDRPITYTQRLKNVQAMLRVSGFVHENGNDFDGMVRELQKQSLLVKERMDTAQQEISNASYILRCLHTQEQYRSIAEEYQSSLLKERFYDSHQNELDLYFAAKNQLRLNNIEEDTAGVKRYETQVTALTEQLAELQLRYDAIESYAEQVRQVMKVAKKVQNDEPVLTERKRGKNYDR